MNKSICSTGNTIQVVQHAFMHFGLPFFGECVSVADTRYSQHGIRFNWKEGFSNIESLLDKFVAPSTNSNI